MPVYVKPFTLFLMKMHKNRRFKKDLQIGYLQKRRYLKTLWISVNVQKRIKSKMLQRQQQIVIIYLWVLQGYFLGPLPTKITVSVYCPLIRASQSRGWS